MPGPGVGAMVQWFTEFTSPESLRVPPDGNTARDDHTSGSVAGLYRGTME